MNRVLSGVGMLLLAAGLARGAPKPALLPVQEGNYWILESSLGDQKIIRCEPGTNTLLQVTGLSDRPVTFYGSPKSAALYQLDPGRAVPLPFPTPAGGGQLYHWEKPRVRRVVSLRPAATGHASFSAGAQPCDQLLVELQPVTGSIRTTSGTYTDCSVFEITTADQPIFTVCDLLAERVYFAPGVGPVAYQGKLDRLYLLVEAQVGDTRISGQ